MKLILFDIDGTLVNTGGAGTRALSRAIESVMGLPNALEGIRLDGKTDPLIVTEAARKGGLEEVAETRTLDDVFNVYVAFLRDELERGSEGYQVLPGIRELLRTLEGNPDTVLGLATGNIEEGARLKLEAGRLNQFFPFGGFGCDSSDRTELIRAAIQRGKAAVAPRKLCKVFVVGDTPRDVFHGARAGANVLAVATGSYSRQELESAGASLVLSDLRDRSRALEFLSLS